MAGAARATAAAAACAAAPGNAYTRCLLAASSSKRGSARQCLHAMPIGCMQQQAWPRQAMPRSRKATTARTSTMAPLRSGSVAASIVSTEPMSTSSAEGGLQGAVHSVSQTCVRNGQQAGQQAGLPKGQVTAPCQKAR